MPNNILEEHLTQLAVLKAHLAAVYTISKEMIAEFVQDNKHSQTIVRFRKLQAIVDISSKVFGNLTEE